MSVIQYELVNFIMALNITSNPNGLKNIANTKLSVDICFLLTLITTIHEKLIKTNCRFNN